MKFVFSYNMDIRDIDILNLNLIYKLKDSSFKKQDLIDTISAKNVKETYQPEDGTFLFEPPYNKEGLVGQNMHEVFQERFVNYYEQSVKKIIKNKGDAELRKHIDNKPHTVWLGYATYTLHVENIIAVTYVPVMGEMWVDVNGVRDKDLTYKMKQLKSQKENADRMRREN